MDLVDYLTVENKVKFDGHEKIKIDNPSNWLWSLCNDIWQPILKLDPRKQ